MAKTAGGVRTYRQDSSTYRKRQAEVAVLRASGRYSSVEMGKGGGWLAMENSTARHKPEEMEAARILADKGYKVTLKDEATGLHGVKTPDGYLFNVSFEQRTPQVGGAKSFSNSLEHAKSKRADIAVVYDRNKVYNRKEVEDGIRRYEQYNAYRFKRIIVVSARGNVHRHKHNG